MELKAFCFVAYKLSAWGFVLDLLLNLVEDMINKIRLMANIKLFSFHLYLIIFLHLNKLNCSNCDKNKCKQIFLDHILFDLISCIRSKGNDKLKCTQNFTKS